jgi:hypothetical protein
LGKEEMSTHDEDHEALALTPRAQLFRKFSHLVRLLPPVEKKEDLVYWYSRADLLHDPSFTPVWEVVPHDFDHFLVDADIRLKDPSYKQHQEEHILRRTLEIVRAEIQAGVLKKKPNKAPEPTA